MAEQHDQERTEQATPKRLEEARRKGQIPRSRELSAAAVMLTGGLALCLLGGQLTGQFSALMRQALSISREQAMDTRHLVTAFGNAAADGLWICAPLLGAVLL